MKVLRPMTNDKEGLIGYAFHCPGCEFLHGFYTKPKGDRPCWEFDDNMEAPTFKPSLLVTWHDGPKRELRRCHSYVRNGKVEFLSDCTHKLAGQMVPMVEVDY